jgi:hypothetical protein
MICLHSVTLLRLIYQPKTYIHNPGYYIIALIAIIFNLINLLAEITLKWHDIRANSMRASLCLGQLRCSTEN